MCAEISRQVESSIKKYKDGRMSPSLQSLLKKAKFEEETDKEKDKTVLSYNTIWVESY